MLLASPLVGKLNPLVKIGLGAALDKVTPELMDNPDVQGFFVTMNSVAEAKGMNLLDYVKKGEIFTDVLERLGVDRAAYANPTTTTPRLVARQLDDGTLEYKVIRPE
jgi:hypothetical protein